MAGLLSSDRQRQARGGGGGGGLLTEPRTIDERVAGLLGLDPTVDRGAVFPMGRDAEGNMVLAWPQMAVDSLKSLMLPGHVMKGGEFTPRDVTEMALDVGMLSSVVPAPAGAKRMFGGIGAKNAPLDDLAKAEAMEKAGEAADDIWRATGWGRGADGKWRFEIDDSGAYMESVRNAPEGYFKIQHEEAQGQYPEMWDTLQQSIRRGDTDTGSIGQYNPETNTIKVRGKTGHQSTALHELQHAVQQREGFAKGGSATEFKFPFSSPVQIGKVADDEARYLREAAEIKRRMRGGVSARDAAFANAKAKAVEFADPITGKPDVRPPRYEAIEAAETMSAADLKKAIADAERRARMTPHEGYRRLAGEVEARNVQSRMNMDAAERRATPPWATEDVPRDQQIVRGLLNY